MTGLPVELTCRELVELVTDWLEGKLPPHERARFEAHLVACEACRAHLQQMRHLLDATGRLAEEDVPPAARDALLHAFRAWRSGGG
jgi:anti-sigma factor RsiW